MISVPEWDWIRGVNTILSEMSASIQRSINYTETPSERDVSSEEQLDVTTDDYIISDVTSDDYSISD